MRLVRREVHGAEKETPQQRSAAVCQQQNQGRDYPAGPSRPALGIGMYGMRLWSYRNVYRDEESVGEAMHLQMTRHMVVIVSAAHCIVSRISPP